jgi:hypothetical protein
MAVRAKRRQRSAVMYSETHGRSASPRVPSDPHTETVSRIYRTRGGIEQLPLGADAQLPLDRRVCVGALGEASEPAQVAEQRGNLPPMAFELLL